MGNVEMYLEDVESSFPRNVVKFYKLEGVTSQKIVFFGRYVG
jgi:hypothetical protein